jgi:hypothetical protein
MPHNGFSTHLRRSPTRTASIPEGRRQMARAAHNNFKKVELVGGAVGHRLVRFSSGVVDCYAARGVSDTVLVRPGHLAAPSAPTYLQVNISANHSVSQDGGTLSSNLTSRVQARNFDNGRSAQEVVDFELVEAVLVCSARGEFNR